MVQNIEKVLERGERIELLVDKTDSLKFQVGVWMWVGWIRGVHCVVAFTHLSKTITGRKV